MKYIELTKGQRAIVDDDDFEELSKHKWHASKGVNAKSCKFYAARHGKSVGGKQSYIRMHRQVMGNPKGMLVDHRKDNTLDNRKENLRVCTRAENARHRGPNLKSVHGYKGVTWDKTKWLAKIGYNHQPIRIGRFFCLIKAAKAYDEAAKKYHGEYAYLNFPG